MPTQVSRERHAPLPIRRVISTITAHDTTRYAPGSEIVIVTATAGAAVLVLSSGDAVTISLAVGTLRLPWAVTGVKSTGTTAVATYVNLDG